MPQPSPPSMRRGGNPSPTPSTMPARHSACSRPASTAWSPTRSTASRRASPCSTDDYQAETSAHRGPIAQDSREGPAGAGSLRQAGSAGQRGPPMRAAILSLFALVLRLPGRVLFTTLALALAAATTGAKENEPHIAIVTIEGAIGPASADHVSRAIARAERDGANLVVLQMDTPGGL